MGAYDVPFSQSVSPALRPIFSMKEIGLGFGEILNAASLPYIVTISLTISLLIFFVFLVSGLQSRRCILYNSDSCFHYISKMVHGRDNFYFIPGYSYEMFTAWKDIFRYNFQDHRQLDE
jgi:hypothetical protein